MKGDPLETKKKRKMRISNSLRAEILKRGDPLGFLAL